jgi:PhoPQ-activated pathogenicity-related protein
MSLTEEERKRAIEYANNHAEFMFMPTPELREKIVYNHPMTVGIIDPLRTFVLEGKPIHITAEMVVQYCKGTLDINNTWLFDQGHIKVIPQRLDL